MVTTFMKFQSKFNVEELEIYSTEHWIWSLRPLQTTLGAGILSLKRECKNFSDLEMKEFCELSTIIKIIGSSLKETFDYDAIN
jgi:diadenosine tetraphosphate (Ap4A) HIT family hydrolase